MNIVRIVSATLLCAAMVVSCGKTEKPNPKPIPDPVDPTYFGIKNYADLKAFADSVNAEASLERFCNEAGEVILLNDIDMSEAPADAVWTPIGNSESIANAANCEYDGPAFRGIFNGQDFAIRNFKADVLVPANQAWGIFGVLDGATIKNLVLGAEKNDQSSVTIEATALADAGILAGTALNGARIMKCTNYIPLKVKGTRTNAKRMAVGVFAGFACSSGRSVYMSKLVNNGPIEMATGVNSTNGVTGIIVGGILGLSTSAGSAKTTVVNCENKADLSGSCGHSSGIIAMMYANTVMRSCNNYGNNRNDFTNGSVGNLSCIMGTGCTMEDCTNFGECITSDAQTATAGMVALLNSVDVVITGGGNYGKIIGANDKYHGLLCANFNNFSSVKGVYAGGSCGTYAADNNHVMHELDKDNWLRHIGCYPEVNASKITELSSPWGEGGGRADFADFPELKDASLRILFIGNSFTMDAVTHLPGICEAASVTDITMVHCYFGGRTLSEFYTDRTYANNELYYANPGAAVFTEFDNKASIMSVARSGRWDVLTIQEHTGNYRAWSWNDKEKETIQNLIGYVASTQTKAPKVFYIMSQAYFDMSKISSGSQPYITWSDQAGMYKVICDQAKKVLDETSVDEVIATGTMLQNLRSSEINNANDLTRDGYHMDYGIARYGAACTVFEKIITPITGKTLEGNTFRYSSTQTGTTNVTDENAPIAREAAHYAVEKPFEVTSME